MLALAAAPSPAQTTLLDAASLVEVTRWPVEPPLTWLQVLDERRALAGDGRRVLSVALPVDGNGPRVVAGLVPPSDLGPVAFAVLAPDRRHLALASGCAVRIVVLD